MQCCASGCAADAKTGADPRKKEMGGRVCVCVCVRGGDERGQKIKHPGWLAGLAYLPSRRNAAVTAVVLPEDALVRPEAIVVAFEAPHVIAVPNKRKHIVVPPVVVPSKVWCRRKHGRGWQGGRT